MSTRRGLLVGVLMLAVACGGGDDDDAAASDAGVATTPTTAEVVSTTTVATTTSTTAEKELDESALRALDYVAALATPADYAFVPQAFEAEPPFDTTDSSLRRQCNQTGDPPAFAVAGMGLELLQADGLASLTTSVQAFADEAAASEAFAFARGSAEPCSAWTNDDDEFVRVSPPSIPDAGDESFSLFSRKPATGLLVADHFVRVGPFVHNLRYAVDGTTALVGSGAVLSEIAQAADARFLAWAEEQLA